MFEKHSSYKKIARTDKGVLHALRYIQGKKLKALLAATAFIFLSFLVSTGFQGVASAMSYSKFVQTVNAQRQEGNPNANTTIVVYSDFQCPWCRKFEEKDLSSIKKMFVKTGKVFIQYRDFPLTMIHPYAFKAAEYADCSALQGRYLDVRSILYKKQDNWAVIGDIYYFLKTQMGSSLDMGKIIKCVKSGYPARLINDNTNSGHEFDITGTPTILIYQGLTLYKKIVGYHPAKWLDSIIEKALQQN